MKQSELEGSSAVWKPQSFVANCTTTCIVIDKIVWRTRKRTRRKRRRRRRRRKRRLRRRCTGQAWAWSRIAYPLFQHGLRDTCPKLQLSAELGLGDQRYWELLVEQEPEADEHCGREGLFLLCAIARQQLRLCWTFAEISNFSDLKDIEGTRQRKDRST